MGKRFAKKIYNYYNWNKNGRESSKKIIFSENTKTDEPVVRPIFHQVLGQDLNPFYFIFGDISKADRYSFGQQSTIKERYFCLN